MASVFGFLIGGGLTWLLGPWAVMLLLPLVGNNGIWIGPVLVFLAGFVVPATLFQGVFTGIVREGIWSSAMLRPVKGFAASVLVWLLTLWLIRQAVALVAFLFPAFYAWYAALWTRPDESLGRLFCVLMAFGLSVSLTRYVKIFIGRATRPVRRLLRAFTFGQGGSSQFVGMLEEWACPWRPGLLLLGTSLYSPGWKVGVPDDRHFITVATSRSGKGRSGIIPNLLTWPGSALVIDPKGQNAAVTLEAREGRLGQEVFVVDPFGMLASIGLADRAKRFNPLAEMRLDDLDIVEQIGQVADALVVHDPRGNAFFADSARDLLAGLITHVLTEHMPDEQRTLGTVRRLLVGLGEVDQNGNPVSPTLALMRMNERAGGLARTAAGMIDNLSDRTRGDVIGTAMQQTRWLDSEAMRRCLAASEFSLAGLKRKPSTVYLVLPPQYLEEHARFLRLFINLSIRVASQGGKPRHGFLFVLDEFYALGPMPLLGKAAGLLAGFGVKLWPIVQNLSQLKELYGDNWETFLGNAGLWQVFAVNDETTARYFSERLGHHISWRKVRSPEGGYEWQPQGATWLRTAVEFAKEAGRESGNQIIFREGGDAFLLRRAPYDRLFKTEDYSPDPYEPAAGFPWRKPMDWESAIRARTDAAIERIEGWNDDRKERKRPKA